MRLPKYRATALLLVLSLSAWGEEKLPIPDAAKIKEAEKLIHEIFKAEYAQNKPEEKFALAQKLSKLAEESKDDPTAKYVAWIESSKLAAQTGEMDAALGVLDKLAAQFALDVIPLKKAALTAVGVNTRDPELSRAVGGMKILLDTPSDPGASLLVGNIPALRRATGNAASRCWRGVRISR